MTETTTTKTLVVFPGENGDGLPYEDQCRHCEGVIKSLEVLWDQRYRHKAAESPNGLYVWVLTEGCSMDDGEEQHAAMGPTIVTSTLGRALRYLCDTLLGLKPRSFLESTP